MKVFLPLVLVSTVATAQSNDDKAWAIVNKLTSDQLLGQMNQLSIGTIQKDTPNGKVLDMTKVQANAKRFAGSYFDNPSSPSGNQINWNATQYRDMLTQLQTAQLKTTGIPILYGLDSIHGASYVYNTVLFPQAINSGATFNPALVQEYGKFKGRDTKAAGVPWIFNPVLDVTRHKHWPRVYETFGEDPIVVAALGKAVVTGIQSQGVAACFKHFLGYSDPTTGNDRDGAVLTDYDVLNHFVPSFKAAIDAGIKTGMGTYIGINGVQLAANEKMHKGLLRHDLNFQGTMVTDWAEIGLLGPDLQADYELSMNTATYDIVMKIQVDRLKQSVQRQIKLKYDLGLFDTPVPGADLVSLVGDKASEDAALATARESLVLLKNTNNLLPLSPSASVFLTGPSMDDIGLLCGGWTYLWQGMPGDGTYQDINKAKQLAKQHAYTVIVLGERTYAEAPGNGDAMAFPDGLIKYVQEIASTGTKIVLVLTEGRPRLLNGIADLASAVIWAGLPCEMGGQAIAEVIVGKVNPSGKLPYVYPKSSDNTNLATPYYFRKNDRCVKMGSNDACPAEWQYGEGLSYTTFAYTNMQ
ncbi:hypothetical protein As57867_017172, partial [Aphanomyces stellatus]